MNAVVRYGNPLATLSDLFDDLLNGNVFEAAGRQLTGTSWPRVDITESEKNYILRADVPGLDKKDLSVTVENGVLTIKGEKKEERKTEKDRYYHFERSYGKFSRSFALPEEVDSEHIEAKMENGVLELSLPKIENARPKAIEVKVN
jgi:HSP20 family protein